MSDDLTPTYDTPTFQSPDAPTQLFEIVGMFPMVTALPTWTPKTFQQSFAVDTSKELLYFYDFTNNAWEKAGSSTPNKDVVVALTDGATPALNAALGNQFYLAAGGDRTIAIPTNPATGQKIIIIHYASGGGRTLSLNSGTNGFRFGSDITALTQTASGKKDYIGCRWNDVDSKWDVVAYTKNF